MTNLATATTTWSPRRKPWAAAEAAEIGGHTDSQRLPEAEAATAEGGEGAAEGFELAEQQLIQSASHGEKRGHPLGDGFLEETPDRRALRSTEMRITRRHPRS